MILAGRQSKGTKKEKKREKRKRTYYILRVSEELAPKSIRDENIWSLYASLDQHLGYFILAT